MEWKRQEGKGTERKGREKACTFVKWGFLPLILLRLVATDTKAAILLLINSNPIGLGVLLFISNYLHYETSQTSVSVGLKHVGLLGHRVHLCQLKPLKWLHFIQRRLKGRALHPASFPKGTPGWGVQPGPVPNRPANHQHRCPSLPQTAYI